MKLLVTGAVGFVGSHLVRRARELGHHVIAVSRRGEAPVDLTDYGQLHALLGRSGPIDAALHVAARLPAEGATLRHFVDGNVVTTASVLQAAREFSIPRVVLSSTMSVYGKPASQPVTEQTPAVPTEAYGRTKLQAEELARMAAEQWGLHVVTLRYCGIFGLGYDYGSIHLYASRVLAGQPVEVFAQGRIVKDFVAVQDVVEANLCAVDCAGQHSYEVVNIGGGEPLPLSEVAQHVIEAAGGGELRLTDARPAGVADFAFDIAKARALLGYHPPPLRQRIREYVAARRRASEGPP